MAEKSTLMSRLVALRGVVESGCIDSSNGTTETMGKRKYTQYNRAFDNCKRTTKNTETWRYQLVICVAANTT